MIYGYARVSSAGQGLYGNGLDVQCRELRSHGAEIIYQEAYTGTKEHRPELDKLIETVKAGDTVIVVKMDRIARSVSAGVEIIDQFIEKGVTLDVLNMGRFDNSPAGKLMRTMMLAFAEFERDMIVERTQAGKEIAKQRDGYREGRKPLSADIRKRIESGERWDTIGISRAAWYKYRSAGYIRSEGMDAGVGIR